MRLVEDVVAISGLAVVARGRVMGWWSRDASKNPSREWCPLSVEAMTLRATSLLALVMVLVVW